MCSGNQVLFYLSTDPQQMCIPTSSKLSMHHNIIDHTYLPGSPLLSQDTNSRPLQYKAPQMPNNCDKKDWQNIPELFLQISPND